MALTGGVRLLYFATLSFSESKSERRAVAAAPLGACQGPVGWVPRTGWSACVMEEIGLMRMPSWLGWLLAAGLALTPAAVRAQGGNYTAPDPVFPFPIGHDRMESGGLYVASEVLLWQQTVYLHKEPI